MTVSERARKAAEEFFPPIVWREEAIADLTLAFAAFEAEILEDAAAAALDRQGTQWFGDGHRNSAFDIGVSSAADAVRQLQAKS